MSKKGLLKAEFNRVRTSNALKGNDMWNTTIGMEANPQAGSNSAIEASLYAPQRGGGQRAMEKQANAAEMATKAGYEGRATDYKGLMALAKAQGVGSVTRGACKLCGCLGHLTRKCTNVVSGHTANTGVDEIPGATKIAAGTAVLGLLPEAGDLAELSDLSSSSSSGLSDSDSDSDSSSGRDRKRRRKDKKSSKSSKKPKKEKSSKDKKHKKSKKSSKDKKHRKDKKRSRHSDDE